MSLRTKWKSRLSQRTLFLHSHRSGVHMLHQPVGSFSESAVALVLPCCMASLTFAALRAVSSAQEHAERIELLGCAVAVPVAPLRIIPHVACLGRLSCAARCAVYLVLRVALTFGFLRIRYQRDARKPVNGGRDVDETRREHTYDSIVFRLSLTLLWPARAPR